MRRGLGILPGGALAPRKQGWDRGSSTERSTQRSPLSPSPPRGRCIVRLVATILPPPPQIKLPDARSSPKGRRFRQNKPTGAATLHLCILARRPLPIAECRQGPVPAASFCSERSGTCFLENYRTPAPNPPPFRAWRRRGGTPGTTERQKGNAPSPKQDPKLPKPGVGVLGGGGAASPAPWPRCWGGGGSRRAAPPNPPFTVGKGSTANKTPQSKRAPGQKTQPHPPLPPSLSPTPPPLPQNSPFPPNPTSPRPPPTCRAGSPARVVNFLSYVRAEPSRAGSGSSPRRRGTRSSAPAARPAPLPARLGSARRRREAGRGRGRPPFSRPPSFSS